MSWLHEYIYKQTSLAIQNEIVRIAKSIAKLSADKFLQQREK